MNYSITSFQPILVDSYSTSAFNLLPTSAYPNPSQYNTSGSDITKDIVFFTSASSYQ